jgi:hypothetical protein
VTTYKHHKYLRYSSINKDALETEKDGTRGKLAIAWISGIVICLPESIK